MESTQSFLRRLCRFNDEVAQNIQQDRTIPPPLQERLIACRSLESELYRAIDRRQEAEDQVRTAQQMLDLAKARWSQAELDERIACANAELQVWTLLAEAHSEAPTPISSAPQRAYASPKQRSPFWHRLFRVAPSQDDSYHFFTITRSTSP